MTPVRRHQLRTALLMLIDAAKPYALELPALRLGLPHHGFRGLADEMILPELDYLVEKGLAARGGARLGPEVGEWKITAEGRDFLATEGLS